MKNVTLLTTILFFCAQISFGQSGQLDPTFGNKGIVQTDIGSRFDYNSLARQVLVKPDGSIFIVLDATFISKRFASGSIDSSYGVYGYSRAVPLGSACAALQNDGKIVVAGSYFDTSFAISRINTDGMPDSTFGKNGIQILKLNPKAVAIQTDGEIVVAGHISNANNESYFAVARYKSDGSADNSFNGTGQQTTDFKFTLPPDNPGGDSVEIHNAYGNAVAIQANGKIVVGGYAYTGIDNDFAIARYNSDGSADNSFNNDGRQTSGIGSADEVGYSLAIQNDNKIILAGYTSSATNNFALVRYNTNGSLDDTFSGDGKQTVNIGSDMQIGNSVAIQSSGKIIVAGYTLVDTLNDFALVRFNHDGSIDDTFGNNGKLTTDFASSDDYAGLITLQNDDKIIVTGFSYIYPTNSSGSTRQHFAISRYNLNGDPDSSFNGDGKLTGNYKQSNTVFNSTAIQPDKKIIAAGVTWNGSDFDFALTRYNIDGSLDSTFNGDGKQITDFETEDDNATSVKIQKDGKIIIAGSSNSRFAIARFNTDGSPDSSFSGDGKIIIPMGIGDVLRSIVLQNDGKIVVAGYTFTDANYDSADFAIARLNTDGTLDNTFSGDGKVLTNFDSSSSFGAAVAIQNNGKIVAAGRAVLDGRNNFSIARYNANGNLDTTFSHDGKQNSVFSPGGYYGTSLVIQNDGRIIVAGFNETLGGLNSSFAVARYQPDGDVDTTFNKTGYQTVGLGPDFNFGYSVAIKNDGRIAVGGTNDNFAIVLYNNNGSIDSTFSNDGIQTTSVGTGKSSIQSIAFADNNLYAAGSGDFPGTLGVVASYLVNTQTPPTISLTTPANNASYLSGGNVYLNATATDADGTVSKVEFYRGSTLLFTATDTPYTFKWQHVRRGNYVLVAKATDNSGLFSVSDTIHIAVVANKPPTVSIINPSGSQTFTAPATIDFEASAHDSDGRIVQVSFYNGSDLLTNSEHKAPYTYQWKNVPAGTYTITAVAKDNWSAETTSAPVTVIVASPGQALASSQSSDDLRKALHNNDNTVQLLPNPAHNILKINTTGLQKNTLSTVSVLSASGVVMSTKQLSILQTIQLNISPLANGIYTIKIINGDKVIYKQFIKM